MKWYDGKYHVSSGTNLGKISRGEIVKRGRVIVLRCPGCASLQFFAAEVQDSDEKPTIARALQCGNGKCKRCAEWFRIEHGKAIRLPPPNCEPVMIPDRLKDAGVASPQKLSDLEDTVKEQVFDRPVLHRVR